MDQMTNAVASPTRIFNAPVEMSDVQGAPLYRLRKSFAVVCFEQAGKGRIVFLPEGAELRVIGASSVSGCLEVMCKNEVYNMFQADLLGPWSMPIEKSRPRPGRAAAIGACA